MPPYNVYSLRASISPEQVLLGLSAENDDKTFTRYFSHPDQSLGGKMSYSCLLDIHLSSPAGWQLCLLISSGFI